MALWAGPVSSNIAAHCAFHIDWIRTSFSAAAKRKPKQPQIDTTATMTMAALDPAIELALANRVFTTIQRRPSRTSIGSFEKIWTDARVIAMKRNSGADILIRSNADRLNAAARNVRRFRHRSIRQKLQLDSRKNRVAAVSEVTSASWARRFGSRTAIDSEIRPPIGPKN